MLDPNDRTRVERVDPLIGSILDRRFRIDFRVAAGGFGAIYQATHVKSGHEVALKVLHPQLAGDPGVVARFRREGATLTTLRSPHTIIAYELGEADDGILYIVMELLRGESLFERYRAQGRMPWRQMVAIARAVCDSLEEAHGRGIVHRDLKPTNIHLEPRDGEPDFVKVLDFGIAKILQDSEYDNSDLTSVGQMIGTLDYMSPEQMVGGVLTGQSDIYTLGIVIYEMIAGVRPFPEASSAATALAAIISKPPPRLSRRMPVPPQLDELVESCLARDPAERYATVAELAAELDALIEAADRDEDNDVTQTVALEDAHVNAASGSLESIEADSTVAMDATAEATMFAVPPPPKQVASRLTPMPTRDAPPMGAASPVPPPGFPAPVAFTTTLQGGQRAPAIDRASRPAIIDTASVNSALRARDTGPTPHLGAVGDYPRAPDAAWPGRPGDDARSSTMPRLVWIAVLVLGALIGVVAASQL